MKPLTKRPATRSAESAAAVARLLDALDRAGEGVALAALDDATLAGVAAAVSQAADFAGRWLAGHPSFGTERCAPPEAVSMAAALKPYEKAAAADRQAATQGNKQSGGEKFTPPERGKARDKVAATVGMSAPTLAKAEAVAGPDPAGLWTLF